MSERYRQGLLSKLYNLRREEMSIEVYYDEFQNLLFKLEYNEDEEHTKNQYKVGLNKEIVSRLSIHKFFHMDVLLEETIDD